MQLFASVSDTSCRNCGSELKVMAVCVSCGMGILYGCASCGIFSDTRVHIDCLNQISLVGQET